MLPIVGTDGGKTRQTPHSYALRLSTAVDSETKTPLAVVGTLVNFTIWFVCTLAVAYEVLVLLLPWAMGWKATVNVTLARTLFWFFGHALVYF